MNILYLKGLYGCVLCADLKRISRHVNGLKVEFIRVGVTARVVVWLPDSQGEPMMNIGHLPVFIDEKKRNRVRCVY